METIEINGNAWSAAQTASDGLYDTPEVPTVAESNYIVLQTTGPPGAEEQDQLEEDQVEILQFLGNNVYLCGFKPTDPKDLESVIERRSFVVDAKIFHPNCVAEPALKEGSPEDKLDVQICLHADIPEDKLDEVRDKIASAIHVPRDSVEITDDGVTKISIQRDQLKPLALVDEVFAINEYELPVLYNDVACDIIKARNHMQATGASTTTLDGSGQNVFVCDTGFDTGNTSPASHHPAFEKRVKGLFPLGRPTTGLSDDIDGHGTHVAGSVLGKLMHNTRGMIEAPASGAHLYLQSVHDGTFVEGPPGNWNASLNGLIRFPAGPKLFQPALDQEAYIHTNSWGGGRGYHAQDTGSIDDFAWRNPSLTVLFAAGNSGRGVNNNRVHLASTVGAQASAKNCITVGASESSKHKLVPGSNRFASPNDLPPWTSCGPPLPGRHIKPDIVAPGTAILSAKSSVLDPNFRSDPDLDGLDDRWQFMQGTSMATPLVAGCCAVLRGALLDANPDTTMPPSSALIKALLVNGADPLSNFSFSVSGFGRVNMANTLTHLGQPPLASPPLAGFGERSGADALRLSRGGNKADEFTFSVAVPEDRSGSTLSVTIAWIDIMGARLQNQLQLSVLRPGEPARTWDLDEFPNNVQRITWKNAPAGTYQVLVKAIQLLRREAAQPFAYAWRIF
ncbi:peptidase S8/S53 domain-containing protein [Schizothecium vesticola]|uniref:Peptidase S8/S53 domain-containing protein n=1 Tax=Schizothecium vesticola TaxID=314040 RepID=A0AA40EWX8_9PEZI|nr:peptidase S8/S53 domain-containing protein [Schizothecium vesticola]